MDKEWSLFGEKYYAIFYSGIFDFDLLQITGYIDDAVIVAYNLIENEISDDISIQVIYDL